jgi:hypothetical protein
MPRTAWTFQLLRSGDFQLVMNVDNMGPSDLFVYRVTVVRENGEVVDRPRTLISRIILVESGETVLTISQPSPDQNNDTYYSVLCAPTKGPSPSEHWSWTLGVKQGDARCPLSWGPMNTGGQCITSEGVRDPCQGGYPFEGDVDESVIVFDVLPPVGP